MPLDLANGVEYAICWAAGVAGGIAAFLGVDNTCAHGTKELSEKQLARAKSLRKEQDDAARSARESERSGASTPTPFLGSDRSGANTPSTPERPPTVEEAAERLFGDL